MPLSEQDMKDISAYFAKNMEQAYPEDVVELVVNYTKQVMQREVSRRVPHVMVREEMAPH